MYCDLLFFNNFTQVWKEFWSLNTRPAADTPHWETSWALLGSLNHLPVCVRAFLCKDVNINNNSELMNNVFWYSHILVLRFRSIFCSAGRPCGAKHPETPNQRTKLGSFNYRFQFLISSLYFVKESDGLFNFALTLFIGCQRQIQFDSHEKH